MSTPKDLLDIRNHLYDRSERLWWITIWLAICTQVLAVLAVWKNNTVFLAIVGLISLMSPIAINWIREQAEGLTIKADKCRRLILYADGLGGTITKAEIASVRACVMGWTLKDAPFVSPYYSSDKPKGPNQLSRHSERVSFFYKPSCGSGNHEACLHINRFRIYGNCYPLYE